MKHWRCIKVFEINYLKACLYKYENFKKNNFHWLYKIKLKKSSENRIKTFKTTNFISN